MDCEADIVRQRIDLNLALRVTPRFSDARISNKMSVFEGDEISSQHPNRIARQCDQ
jgi:hypothetical protein